MLGVAKLINGAEKRMIELPQMIKGFGIGRNGLPKQMNGAIQSRKFLVQVNLGILKAGLCLQKYDLDANQPKNGIIQARK